MRYLSGLFAFGLMLVGDATVSAQQWATVKGQVVFAGDALPPVGEVNVDKDKEHCLSKGKILSEEWIINPKKGVKNVFVWLAPVDPTGKLPIHPDLAAAPKTDVEVDQPCCAFVPHAVALREGQKLVVKNSSPIAHNVNWSGGKKIEPGNVIVPAGQQHVIGGLKADRLPVSFSCNVHPWMKGYARVFDHPYFALTDADGNFEIPKAPAGNYMLISWHEGCGWGQGGKTGILIQIKDGAEPVKVEVKPS